ncbi:hypothetical protein BS78_02G372000 [Paspalum vaginatum]|nr:hypothetical protein BS78_02G372000 [Paspalum vaginatum]
MPLALLSLKLAPRTAATHLSGLVIWGGSWITFSFQVMCRGCRLGVVAWHDDILFGRIHRLDNSSHGSSHHATLTGQRRRRRARPDRSTRLPRGDTHACPVLLVDSR